MKRLISFSLLCALFACSNHRENTRNKAHSGNPGSLVPKLEFTEEIHNFGRLNAGETVVYDFSFINSGDGNLEIKNIETGCTCLTVESPEGEVKPGKKGALKVIFDTSGLYGLQFQAFRVITSGKAIDLAVTAEIINENIRFNN
jgi:hypothetical protein